jgi:DNA-binding NarL/FixJ family response regulator
MDPIRVLLADDQQIVLDGLSILIEHDPRFVVVGRAADGEQAVRLTDLLAPHVVVMDVRMPLLDGIEATRMIKDRHREVHVLMLSTYDHGELINGALEAGASGYALKTIGGRDLLKALEDIAMGYRYLDEASQRMLDDLAGDDGDQQQVHLTRRERDVIQLIVQEKSNLEIASTLGLQVGTVETHRKNIFGKLKVHGVVGLVRYAIDRGWDLPNGNTRPYDHAASA